MSRQNGWSCRPGLSVDVEKNSVRACTLTPRARLSMLALVLVVLVCSYLPFVSGKHARTSVLAITLLNG